MGLGHKFEQLEPTSDQSFQPYEGCHPDFDGTCMKRIVGRTHSSRGHLHHITPTLYSKIDPADMTDKASRSTPGNPTNLSHNNESTLPDITELTNGTPSPGCGPEDSPKDHASYDLPKKEQLEKAFKLQVLDKDGNTRNFGDLCQDGAEGVERNLVIFIRHWFCGVLQVNVFAVYLQC